MIKNIIFDIGNVLLNFKPREYMKELQLKDEIIDNMDRIIFKDKLWLEADRGTFTIQELINILIEKNPSYQQQIETVLNKNWVEIHTRKEDSINYMKELKEIGYNIYLLSNCSKEAHDFIMKYDFIRLINGGVYSYELNICKPEKDIYLELVKKYNIKPEESIFIDDNKDNIKASIELGFNGIVFDNLKDVKENVNKLINN